MSKTRTNDTKTVLRGIVVAGNSRQDVEENYRSVVTGVSVKALQPEDNSFTILSNADADISLFNPLTGMLDLVTASDDLIGRMEFLASDSEQKVTAFYSLCSDSEGNGCNSHLIADDPELLKHCPVCASTLKMLDEDDINELLSSSSDDEDDDCPDCSEDSIISVANSYEEAQEAYYELVSGTAEPFGIRCEYATILSNVDSSEFSHSPFTSKASADVDLDDFDTEAIASAGAGEQTANYYVCANTEGCGKHIISSSDNPVFCPSCSSGLIEPEDDPEAIASDKETELGKEDAINTLLGEKGNIVAVAATAKEAKAQFISLSRLENDDVHTYDCEGTVVASNIDNSEFSFSPFDGESVSEVDVSDDFEIEIIASGSKQNIEAHHYVCSADDECGMHIVASVEVESCPSCSSGLIEPESTSSDDEEDDYDEEDEEEDFEDDDEDDDDDDFDSESAAEEEEYINSLSSEDLDDYLDSLSSDDEDDSDDDEDDSDDDEDDSDDDEDDDDGDDDSDNTLSVSSVKFKSSKRKPEDSTVAVSLLSIASSYEEYDAAKLEVSCAGTIQNETTWIAFYDGMPVAKATASNALKHSDIFNKPLFGNAFLATAKENSVQEALSAFGFKEFCPEFNVESHVENEIATQVEAKVKDVEDKHQTESNDYNERMQSALATAAQGINRNFFKGIVNPNPIKTALASSLAAAGLREPEAIIAKAFADHSDAYHKNLINKASEIVAKSIEIQNELAEAVAGSNPSTNTDTVVPIGTPAKLPTQKPMESTSSVSSGEKPAFSRMDAILAGLGQRK
jgi:hypothetical protein